MVMSTLNEQTVFDEIAAAQQFFAAAPQAFFDAWRRGVELAGPALFGEGTRESFDRAAGKWDLCPNVDLISEAISVMSSGERVFLAAMVSFYNAEHGGALLKRVGVHGLADLGGLDLKRRRIIADLLMHYSGW
jgi:hypothetical protein